VVPQTTRVTRNSPQPVTPTPRTPTLSADDIQRQLGSASTSTANEHLAYCARLKPYFRQPTSAPYGTKAVATIRVDATGTITYRALTSPSGNTAFDQSVLAALNAVSRLPAPPTVSVNRNITVTFEIQ
jgi:TonB family protein